jgi:hypothetical protein
MVLIRQVTVVETRKLNSMKIQPPKTATSIRLRRQELLNELREAIPRFGNSPDKELLEFCNITNETMVADCTWTGSPWAATILHYSTLGIRSVRARGKDRFPDGSVNGSDKPEATTPTYREIIDKKAAELVAKRRRRA